MKRKILTALTLLYLVASFASYAPSLQSYYEDAPRPAPAIIWGHTEIG